jgi:hypothetical protein
MKMYGGVEVQLHALDGNEGIASRSGRFDTLGDERAFYLIWILCERKNICPHQDSNPDSLAFQAILRYPASLKYEYTNPILR